MVIALSALYLFSYLHLAFVKLKIKSAAMTMSSLRSVPVQAHCGKEYPIPAA